MISIEDKIREARLRWFGHIKKRSLDALLRRCEQIVLSECRRGCGRFEKNWNEVI